MWNFEESNFHYFKNYLEYQICFLPQHFNQTFVTKNKKDEDTHENNPWSKGKINLFQLDIKKNAPSTNFPFPFNALLED